MLPQAHNIHFVFVTILNDNDDEDISTNQRSVQLCVPEALLTLWLQHLL